jgi:flagellar biosynthesis protein
MAENRRPRRAAALSYDPERDGAPILSAFGEGFVAERIVESAKKSGVPVVSDSPLAEVLARLSVGDEIPAELYEVVAKLLLFVSEIDRGYGDKLKLRLEE